MKKQIIITLILLAATVYVTVVYFKNLNPPGMRISQVMKEIPDNSPFVFEFNNDKGFYDVFNGNKLFAAVIGKQKIDEFNTLRRLLLENPLLVNSFLGQNIYISIHPSKANDLDLLLTVTSAKGFENSLFDQLSKTQHSGLLITPLLLHGKQGYNIYITELKKRFYIINKDGNIFSGSFSKELIEECSTYISDKNKPTFVLLSEKQNANSLANLYINYSSLSPVFNQLFQNKNTDIFKSLRLLPGLAALSLNYRTDALMFNGTTNIKHNEAAGYLNLFVNQQPVINHLKDIFPSTTAYSLNLSVSNTQTFFANLSDWQNKAGGKTEKDKLFDKIKAETGTNLKTEFKSLLANEFAVVTTRYFEKLAVISVKDGSKLKLLMATISTMSAENAGQFNYDKVPFFLLGDAFSVFRRPYFMIIDNYLILATSTSELSSYNDSYINRKFLSKNEQYNQFDVLTTARSNVSFFFNFKNSMPLLERDLYPGIYQDIQSNDPGWKNFYGASVQFTAADQNFYTNLCFKLNTDYTPVKN